MLLLLRLRGGGDNVVVRPEVVSVEFWLDLWQLRYSLHFYCHLSSVSDWHVTVEREVNSASVWAGLFPRCAVAVARERLASWTPPPPQHCTVANLEGSHAPDSSLYVTFWRKTFKLIFSLVTISVNILTISSPLSSQWEFAHENSWLSVAHMLYSVPCTDYTQSHHNLNNMESRPRPPTRPSTCLRLSKETSKLIVTLYSPHVRRSWPQYSQVIMEPGVQHWSHEFAKYCLKYCLNIFL